MTDTTFWSFYPLPIYYASHSVFPEHLLLNTSRFPCQENWSTFKVAFIQQNSIFVSCLERVFLFHSSHIFVFWFLVFWSLKLCNFLSVFFCLAHLALQNVNKDYITFSYFRNFIAKSDKKPKTKNGMNATLKEKKVGPHIFVAFLEYLNCNFSTMKDYNS